MRPFAGRKARWVHCDPSFKRDYDMFFYIKKNIMCRALAKRIKQNPFDFQYAESYTLEDDADPLVNNSYYFSAHDGEMSVFARLGKRVNADETWFAVYVDGQMYSLKEETFPVGKAPVQVERVEEGWILSYQGRLNEADEMYGEERLINTLDAAGADKLNLQELLAVVQKSLALHVGTAAQSDDITMLTLSYYGDMTKEGEDV